jgi:hypothetical protein
MVGIAAGSVAAELLAHAPRPPLPESAMAGATPAPLPVFPYRLSDGSEGIMHPKAVLDEIRIASYCIKGDERWPDRWIRNHNSLHADARRLVLMHASLILAVAERVFIEGRWFGARNDLVELFPAAAAASPPASPALPPRPRQRSLT